MKPARSLLALTLLGVSAARADMVNRWLFNAPAGTAPNGTTVADPIAGSLATIRSGTAAGNQASFTGTGLTLPGATTCSQAPASLSAYIDLPNGLISSKTHLSIEIWATPTAVKNWQRLLDFGRTNLTGNAAAQGAGAAPGEIRPTATTSTGTTTPVDNLTLAIHRGTTANTQRVAARFNGATELATDSALSLATGTRHHFVLTFTDGLGQFGPGGGQIAWYFNGTLAATRDVNFRLRDIADVNNWLGRSQIGSDSTAAITYHEVRLYNHPLTPAEIAANIATGPNATLPAPVAVPDSVTLHRGQKAAVAVLTNDSGIASGPTVEVVQAPAFGTAVPDGLGKILYTHTTGTPAGDTFSYRVKGPGGQSGTAAVTVTFSDDLRLSPTGLNLPASPPPLAIQLVPAVTGLSSPVCLATPPGEAQRLFICQKGGLLRVVANITDALSTATTFLDLPALLTSRGESISTNSEQGLLGLAFHPDYAANRQFFLFYSVTSGGSVYERVSRFTTQAANPNAADPSTERILIQQLDEAGNHNGGDIHFGPDGYLYISFGDEGNQNDSLNNSQTITKDFYSAVARIDVDKKPGSLAPNPHPAIPTDGGVARYAVPPDNPYVGATTFNGATVTAASVRTEFWAVGFRNPWRFSFDPANGSLWLGDVGQDTYEEIDIVEKGKNYGWAFREGAHNGAKSGQAPANFNTLYHTPPVYEYVHTGVSGGDASFKGNSVTGGVVYRGSRFPGLTGAYIFADYVSGHVWSLVKPPTGNPTVTRIAGEGGIVGFGTDPSNGDVLLADYDGGRVLRLIVTSTGGNFPGSLAETGLFADPATLAPAPGVLPYTVNLPFWSDHAVKSRWFTLPNPAARMTWSRDGAWTFPAGQIWVKHFDMETTRGNPATKRRLETRLLVRNAGGAYGVSYRWNEAGTEALLVPDGGADFDLAIVENGTPRSQRWRIPSRSECLVCHTSQAGHALSFNTRQLNLNHTLNGFAGNQVALLRDAGYFTNTPEPPNVLPRHLRPDEAAFPVEARARSYLAVNCAYCHQSGGTAAPSAWDGRPHLTLDQTGLLFGNASNNGGDPQNKLVIPGDLPHSILLNRVAVTNGFTRMPPLGSSEPDQTNIALLTDWIGSALPQRQAYDQWRTAKFGSPSSPEGSPTADPDFDGHSNLTEFLTRTEPLSGADFLSVGSLSDGQSLSLTFDVPPNRSAWVESSADGAAWSRWDVPGNHALPATGGPVTLTGPIAGGRQYFRVRIQEN